MNNNGTIRNSESARKYLFLKSKNGKPIKPKILDAGIHGGHSSKKSTEWLIHRLPPLRKWTETNTDDYLGTVLSNGTTGSVIYIFVAGKKTQQKYIAADLFARKIRQTGFANSFGRGALRSRSNKLLPARVIDQIESGEYPRMLKA